MLQTKIYCSDNSLVVTIRLETAIQGSSALVSLDRTTVPVTLKLRYRLLSLTGHMFPHVLRLAYDCRIYIGCLGKYVNNFQLS